MQGIVLAAGSSGMRDGTRMKRVYRDMTMGHGHFGNLLGDSIFRSLGEIRLDRTPEQLAAQPA